ncbi:MAG: hypothetical protein KDK76_03040 [Chlamydiia bacterium]|nr:hypothetical protein [Chlamydiia bacterium]
MTEWSLEIAQNLLFLFCFGFGTYALAKALWWWGLNKKVSSFKKFWGIVAFIFLSFYLFFILIKLTNKAF